MPPSEPTVVESGAAACSSQPPASFWQLARQWAPPVLWMVLILLASSDWLAASETAGLLRKVLTALFGPIPEARFLLIHALLRKTGHAVAYAILSWLAYRSARGPAPAAPPWTWRPALYALSLSLITAVLDEAHQVFTEARTGSAWDVLLDMTGALLALGAISIAARRKQRRQKVQA